MSASACALPIPVFNTGVDGFGVSLPGGSVDPHWDVVTPAGDASVVDSTSYAGTGGIPGTWLPNSSVSKWIWQDASGLPTSVTRWFETTFDMTGLDLSTAAIAGRWAADNLGLNIFINGIDIVPPNPTSPGFTSWTGFSISNADLLPGLNTVRFEVQDLGVISGFRAEFTTATAEASSVPDTGSTLLLAGLSFGVIIRARRAFRA